MEDNCDNCECICHLRSQKYYEKDKKGKYVSLSCCNCASWGKPHANIIFTWIPIEYGLPEKAGRYLVAEKHHSKWMGISAFRDGKFDLEVTHWAPLLPHPAGEE